jgi:hypothetical protein
VWKPEAALQMLQEILMKTILILCISIGTICAADIPVRISSDSRDAADVLLHQLQARGAKHGVNFSRTDDPGAKYQLVVSWLSGGPGFRVPSATVQVFGHDNAPIYSVTRCGFLTRGNAVGQCAEFLVEDLSKRNQP